MHGLVPQNGNTTAAVGVAGIPPAVLGPSNLPNVQTEAPRKNHSLS